MDGFFSLLTLFPHIQPLPALIRRMNGSFRPSVSE
jgi:hypothetical protein